MSADQYVGWGVFALAAGVLAGYSAHRWHVARKSARRYDAASLAFWTSLTAYVDRAYDDIDNDTAARFDARIEAALLEGSATPIGDATAAHIAAKAAETIDAEWRELA